MDCDFSHRPEDIPAMLAAMDDADLVIGSRFCPGGGVDQSWGASRKLLSGFANGLYVRGTLGLPIHDATGGFRLWRREALLAIDPARRLTLSGYGFQVEMAYLAHRFGQRIKEVPIYFSDRARGESKMSRRIVMEAALQVPQLRWRHRHCSTRTSRFPFNSAAAMK
jgi:dolichol-phosphate mannosyltransferase